MKETFLCSECGSENVMNYKFCGACGARLAAETPQSSIACSECGAQNPAGYKFCGQCGAKLGIYCPNCGAAVLPDSRYCPSCAYLCGEGRYTD